MSEIVSESRFCMWRAVFAMVHADHVVTDEERDFMENYLEQVAFSDEQKKTLREDMSTAQNVDDMFDLITDPEDQGQFFQFARMLVWSDGDFDEQEKLIKERLTARQLDKFDMDRIRKDLQESRELAKMQREQDEEQFAQDASGFLNLGSMLRGMTRLGTSRG